ncbi:hypothetical protein R6242_18760 [Iodobacter sp. CM08]|uniref:hypothetical protein n=1 Tax=Iodobacter sp. CM08 TaxID=3085902 RepID=UPI0029815F4D|nr:hypothetical protein [Iodobacter sp. CM08]MDW5418610.1 hypothetical protein [Iodobacter sp. CM08]
MRNEKTFSEVKIEIIDLAFIYRAIAWIDALPPVLRKISKIDSQNLNCYQFSYSITESMGISRDNLGNMLTFGVGMNWISGLPIESVTVDRDYINILVPSFSTSTRAIPAFVLQFPLPADSPIASHITSDEKIIGFALANEEGKIKRVNRVFPLHCRYITK